MGQSKGTKQPNYVRRRLCSAGILRCVGDDCTDWYDDLNLCCPSYPEIILGTCPTSYVLTAKGLSDLLETCPGVPKSVEHRDAGGCDCGFKDFERLGLCCKGDYKLTDISQNLLNQTCTTTKVGVVLSYDPPCEYFPDKFEERFGRVYC